MASLRLCFSILGFAHFFPKVQLLFPLKRSIRSSSFFLNFHVKQIIYRKTHFSCSVYGEKRELPVSHLASQELAISAIKRLKLEVNKFQRAKKLDIELVLKGSLKDLYVDNMEIVFLIRCCGALLRNENAQTRNNLMNNLWKKICISGIQLSNEYFIALLDTYIENGRHVSPKQFLLEMKRLNVEPNRDTLIKLLSCSHSDMGPKRTIDNLLEIVEELKSRGYSANIEMFEALASTLAEAGDLLGAEDIVETMIKVQLEPTAAVYTSLVKGYIKLEDKYSILKVLNEMEKRKLSMSESSYISVVIKLSEAAHSSEKQGSQFAKEISNFLSLMRVSEGGNILHCISNAVLTLVHEKKEEAALSLVLSLPPVLLSGHHFLEPLPILFSKEVVKTNYDAETVIKICDQLENLTVPLIRVEGFLEPYLLHTATGLSLHLGKKILSQHLLRALFLRGAKVRPHYFWPILCAVAKEDNENKEKEILSELKNIVEFEVEADHDTLAHYILPFLDSKYSALDMLTLLKKTGLTGIVPRTAVTCFLISRGDLQQAVNFNAVHHSKINSALIIEPLVAHLIESRNKPSKSTLINMARLLNLLHVKGDRGIDYTGLLLLELCEKLDLMNNGKDVKMVDKNVEYILSVLKFMDTKNMRISPQAEDALLYIIQPKLDLKETEDETKLYMPGVDPSLTLTRTGSQIPHPRNMSLEELELHLVELRAKGFNERGVLRRLLQMYCRLGNLEKALKIKENLESQGHDFSPGMLSSLLDLYFQHSMLEKSEEMYQRIRRNHPKFRLDEYKVLDMATLLTKRGRISDAVELLEQHSKSVKIRPDKSIERNILSLLRATHTSLGIGPENKTEKPKKEIERHDVVAGKAEHWTVQRILQKLVDLGYVTKPLAGSFKDYVEETERQ